MSALSELAVYRESCVGDIAEEPYLAAIDELLARIAELESSS